MSHLLRLKANQQAFTFLVVVAFLALKGEIFCNCFSPVPTSQLKQYDTSPVHGLQEVGLVRHLTTTSSNSKNNVNYNRMHSNLMTRQSTKDSGEKNIEETDVVVIGSGIGGLSAAACIASTGNYRVTVCESHDTPGGAAHEWQGGKGFRFESGPSLYAGLSPDRSPNPLKHVFQIIGEEPEWITYDLWGTYLPEGSLIKDAVGADEFYEKLEVCGGIDAKAQWTRLMERIRPLGDAIFGLPPSALRRDAFVGLTMGRYAPALASVIVNGGSSLQDPFSKILEEENINDPFIRNWLDMICFLLQGATTKDAPTSLMAYMLSDFYRPNVVLDFPKGGTQSIVNALSRGVTKHKGCELRLNTHIRKILVDAETGKAAGVETADGTIIKARKAVISNADLWSTRKMVDATTAPALASELDDRIKRLDRCDSFLHLHVGIDATGLPTTPSESFPAQWASLESWDRGVDAPRNLVLVSMISLLDPSMAPNGCHTIHAYVPATEPYQEWADLDRNSAEYKSKKEEAAQVLWKAIENQIPDVRQRAKVTLVGTPLTHERFLRRDRGSYGPFLKATDGMLSGQTTCLDGLLCCGDSTFPGIGMPAAAASGNIAANTVVSPMEHWKMLDKIKL